MDSTNQALVIAAAQRQDAERKAYELSEARAEINRHHEDFAKISEIAADLASQAVALEDAFNTNLSYLKTSIQNIRNIVG